MRVFARFVIALLAVAIVPAAYAQQPTTVSGQVTASVGGTPLIGAQVSIPTLRVGATTDNEGRYSFTVPASATGGATLTVRRLGYVSVSVPIALTGAPIRQDFALEVGAAALAEVVVTALGLERERSRLGTAQQQLTAGEVNDTRAQNLVQQIQGKVSGVQITSPGTQGGSVNVIIRGQNSITAEQPAALHHRRRGGIERQPWRCTIRGHQHLVRLRQCDERRQPG